MVLLDNHQQQHELGLQRGATYDFCTDYRIIVTKVEDLHTVNNIKTIYHSVVNWPSQRMSSTDQSTKITFFASQICNV